MTDQDLFDRWLDSPAERADREGAAHQAELDAIAATELDAMCAGAVNDLGMLGDDNERDLSLALRGVMAMIILHPGEATVASLRPAVDAHLRRQLQEMAIRHAEAKS
jgi:hypothetical protein